MAETGIDIAAWIRDCIEGSGGMDDFEDREGFISDDPERVAAGKWNIRCLANPRCEGSAEVLDAIAARREAGPAGASSPDRLAAADRDKAELAASLRNIVATLRAFIDYYEIPENHPDAQLIAGEAASADALLERLGARAGGEAR